MTTRTAHARWEGGLKRGGGQAETGSGELHAAYSFASRFDRSEGTNPEELLGAAHASCFAMALTAVLEQAGYKPEYVDATAEVSIHAENGGFRITGSHLICKASVPGIDDDTFRRHAESAKADCPVSRALSETEITLDAGLVH
jgi:osmotically inducible protein OsmC